MGSGRYLILKISLSGDLSKPLAAGQPEPARL
jgi:hypothetical protein